VKEAIAKVAGGESLSEAEAASALSDIMDGGASPAQIAALLVALRVKGETVGEITGFARAMRAKSVKVETTKAPLIDTCGTGGDSLKTFNISTCAAFVVAGAGGVVAKHGNRAVTSRSGSADVLEALGVNVDLDPDGVGRCIEKIGIGFLFARTLHPAMKFVAPVRAELGIRTIFNVLGPLTNPAGATRQVIGVYDESLCEPLARVLLNLGSEHVLVVHGRVGLDEIATVGETFVAEGYKGQVMPFTLTPKDLGLGKADPADLAPGADAAENATILRGILSGESGPRREIVLANAAAALYVAGLVPTLRAGTEKAALALDSGAAREKLDTLIVESNA
jgi:anthranilate phosphoribosyltransferase